MASTWNDVKLQLMATGENLSTWGNVTNANLGTALTELVVGSADVTFASADVTLTLSNTTASQTARNMRLNCIGTTGGARNLILGTNCQIEKIYVVNNGCADAITVKNTTGTGIAVPAGKTMWVYNNGTNVVDVVTSMSSLSVATPIPQASGGTGQSSLQITQYCGAGVWNATPTQLDLTLPAGAVYTQAAGARVAFTVPTTNPAGTITLKVGSNTAATLVNSDSSAVNAADLLTTVVYTALFDGTVYELQTPTATVISTYAQINNGTISGYICSNPGSFSNTQLSVSVGNARDTTNLYSIPRTAGITKKLDATWVAGNNEGGRESATALAANQTWHVFAILNPTTGATDIIFSASPTTPTLTLAVGYTKWRRIMSIVLDSSANIKQFVQTGSYVQLKTRNTEFAATLNGTAAGTLRTMAVPTGLKLLLNVYYSSTTVGGTADPAYSGCYDPDVGAVPVFGSATQWAQIRAAWNGNAYLRYQTTMLQVYTNSSAQIYTASNDTFDTIAGGVVGWLDPRDSYY